MADQDHVFQRLVQDAIEACGGDLTAAQRYIDERTAAMSEEDRQAIRRDIQRVLGFREPDGPPYRDN